MIFDKQKALNLAKNLSNKFNLNDVKKFIDKHKDLEFIQDMKLLFSMVVDSIKGNYNLDTKTYLLITGVLAYVALPTDLIPDFIPGIGFIDDAFVIGWTIKTLKEEIENYKKVKDEKTRETNGHFLKDV